MVNGMKKAVLYARVSSNRQEKEGFSIPAQIKFLRDYALNNDIEIVKEFVEAETAKKAGRTEFNNMVTYLHEHEDQRIILVEKVDRLYRNLPDYGTIDNIKGLEVHFVKENEVLSENSRSGIKFMIGIRVLMAKQYIDNLAEESAKGLNERVEQGYALYPPLGYKYGDDGTHKHAIIIDTERAKYAKRAFELFVYENLSASTINNILYDEGLRTPKGKKYAVSTIQRMFHNVMYVGDYMYQGKLYLDGRHEPLISRQLFQFALDKINKATSTARQHSIEFPYIGLFKCTICGCSYTAERKLKSTSGREYIYYHCTGKGKIKTCKKGSYISQDKIDEYIAGILEDLKYIPQWFIDDISKILLGTHELKNNYSNIVQSDIHRRIKELDKLIQQGYEAMLRNPTSEEKELWQMNYDMWKEEKEALRTQQVSIDKADDNFYEQSNTILDFCKNAHEFFLTATPTQKRTVCEILGSNFSAKGKELSIELYPVFKDIIELNKMDKKYEKGLTRFEHAQMQNVPNKKTLPEKCFNNGGNDEARTRDLMRDRHAL